MHLNFADGSSPEWAGSCGCLGVVSLLTSEAQRVARKSGAARALRESTAHCFYCTPPTPTPELCSSTPRWGRTDSERFLFLLERSVTCFVNVLPRNRGVDFSLHLFYHLFPTPSQPPLWFLPLVASRVSHKIRDFMNVPSLSFPFKNVHSRAGGMSQAGKHLLHKNEEVRLFPRNYIKS